MALQHVVLLSDVEAEKKEKAHLQAVEGFNAANLKHANTKEKIVLPAKEGVFACNFFFFLLRSAFALGDLGTLLASGESCRVADAGLLLFTRPTVHDSVHTLKTFHIFRN